MTLGPKKLTLQQFFTIYLGVLLGLGLIYLGLTGRLHWLFALLGAALPFLGRALPLALRVWSAVTTFKWLKRFSGGQRKAHRASGQRSELNTRFLSMTLDHASGDMDGRVLEGKFNGTWLSAMTLEQLMELHQHCQEDADSLKVLEAYLDRVHPDWSQEETENTRYDSSESGNVTKKQAWEILGLEPGASRKEIIEAHRRLIQRLHPDRGGSSYLAARINEAKRVLVGHKGNNRE